MTGAFVVGWCSRGFDRPGNLVDGVRLCGGTCCRGPVGFDLAHVPTAVSALYPGIDLALLDDCRYLVLAMVAAWRRERDDQFPNGAAFGREILSVLRLVRPGRRSTS